MKRMQEYGAMVGALAVLIVAGASGPVQATSLIVNGDFESQPGTSGSCINITAAAQENDYGWSFIPNAGENGGLAKNWAGATGGNQWLQPEHSDGATTAYQTFDTTVGRPYEISFSYAVVPSASRSFTLTVGIGGDTHVIDIPQTTPGWSAGSLSAWIPTNLFYTATSTSTLLSFTGDQGPNGTFYGTSLDNVSVEEIPEPAIFVLLGTGAGLLWLRRRQQP